MKTNLALMIDALEVIGTTYEVRPSSVRGDGTDLFIAGGSGRDFFTLIEFDAEGNYVDWGAYG